MTTAGFQEKRAELERALNSAFSPHAPINQARFFAGRTEQVRAVVDTIRTPGLHAAIYGERGVGKTSLANIIGEFLEDVVAVRSVNCANSDTFDSAIRRSLQGLRVSQDRRRLGFLEGSEAEMTDLATLLNADGPVGPDDAAALLGELPPYCVLVFDEFDRLRPRQTEVFADFLKSLSDHNARTTAVLVGVAEDITALIQSHASVERCLRQVPLPRMSEDELGAIIDVGLKAAGFNLESEEPKRRVLSISQGFPHYTHLLAQNAARAALDNERTVITSKDVTVGMFIAVDRALQSHRDLYFKATTGTKKKNLWKEVVAACALAESDERGYFSSRAVQDKLSQILDRPIIQQTVAFHLGKLTEEGRGPLLQRMGPERRYRYRFINPLMRPFIFMKAVQDDLVKFD